MIESMTGSLAIMFKFQDQLLRLFFHINGILETIHLTSNIYNLGIEQIKTHLL